MLKLHILQKLYGKKQANNNKKQRKSDGENLHQSLCLNCRFCLRHLVWLKFWHCLRLCIFLPLPLLHSTCSVTGGPFSTSFFLSSLHLPFIGPRVAEAYDWPCHLHFFCLGGLWAIVWTPLVWRFQH